jgi:DNA end-binding protein Ku
VGPSLTITGMKALWKGAITFGLISIPVRLHSAVQEKSLKFHLLHDEDHGRIKYQRVCSKCGKEVTWDDLVRGYEVSKDTYVTFTETYYVAPEPSGLKAYRLLAGALEAEQQVGIAKVALRDKEHLATIRLKEDVFVLETMHWPDEIREPAFEELDKKVDVRDQEVKMARQLVQQLSDDFKPDQFQDEYRVALEALVEQKIEGQEISVAPPPEEEEPPKVVDLMEALKASVEDAKKKRPAAGSKKKTGQRKASAS